MTRAQYNWFATRTVVLVKKREGYQCDGHNICKRVKEMKKLLVLCILVVGLLLGCGGGNIEVERAAIGETIRGYVSSYNASDFEECLTYFADYGDREDALSMLAFFRSRSSELTLVDFDLESSVAVEGSTARVPVEFIVMGERGSQWIHLKKVEGEWKILWEQFWE
ncbi:MAG: hypothetical protein A2Y91_07410 [Chloroflexi bacterium RBG_13_54_8]|nr:MAG: hypothetical protein A2Y91_07410 [Chloroflexi bacterium RBG_13_54_8]